MHKRQKFDMSSRDIIKLYLIDLFSKNFNFRKMTVTDISRRFAYDMGISLTTRIYKKFKKVTIEFLEEILDTESELDFEIIEIPDEVIVSKTVKTKRRNSGNVVTVDESRPAIQKVVQRKVTENDEIHPYYSILSVFKQTGIPLPRLELTEAKTAAAKIEVLQSAMRNAGFEGNFTLENAQILRQKLMAS